MLRHLAYHAALAMTTLKSLETATLQVNALAPKVTNHSSLSIDPYYNFDVRFTDQSIDARDFNIASIGAASVLSESGKGVVVPDTPWRFQAYPDCIVKYFNEPRSSRPVQSEVVMEAIYEGFLGASQQASFTETVLRIQWRTHIVGWVVWRNPRRSDWDVISDTFGGAADFASNTGDIQLENSTSTSFTDIGFQDGGRLRIESWFSSSVPLSSQRVYIAILDAINVIFNADILQPDRVWDHDSDYVETRIAIGPPPGLPRPEMPFLTNFYAIRTLGFLSRFYADAPGWQESTSRTWYDNIYLATTNLTALDFAGGQVQKARQ